MIFSDFNKRDFFISFLFLFILTVVYSLLFNIHLIYKNYPPEYFAVAFFMSVTRGFIIWLTAFSNRWLFVFFTVFTFALGGGIKYATKDLGMSLNIGTFEVIMETNVQEAAGVLNAALVSDIIIGGAIGLIFAVIRFKYIKIKSWKNMALLSALAVVFLIFGKLPEDFMKKHKFGSGPLVQTGRGIEIMPEKLYENIYQYAKNRARIKSMYKKRKEMPLPEVTALTNGDNGGGKTVILVLTDALRPDHMSLYGYERNTTPKMLANGFIPFNDMYACETSTTRSVPCLMSRMSYKDGYFQYLKEPTLITMFKSAGFETAWISAQASISTSDTGQAVIASDADYVFFNADVNKIGSRAARYDRDLFPYIDEYLKRDNKNKFLAINLNGSHWAYSARYKRDEAVFQPDCLGWVYDCKIDEVINAYDNSVIQTDNFIGELIERVKDMNAVIYFTSDHAEFLGEGGMRLHSHEMLSYKEVTVVPFAVWVSDKARDDINTANLLNNKDKITSHDSIFHSVTDCSGLKSKYIDDSLSVCSDRLIVIPNRFEGYESKKAE